MRRFWALLLIMCVPLSPCAASDTTVIAAFGDSLFAGYGLKEQSSFPDQLEHRLRAEGYNANIINFGVSGDTTAGGVSRIDNVVRERPDIFLVELGANDMLRGMQPKDVSTNLDRILSRIHKANIPMLVIGQKAPASYGKAYASTYDPLFCELAKKYEAPCYPFFLKAAYGKPELMQADGMHPNEKGVAAILSDIYPMITKLMKKK